MIPQITEEEIERFLPKAKRYKKGVGKGLNLWIYPNGTKTWMFRYRYHRDGVVAENSVSFGIYPEVSIDEAWEKTFEAREQMREGILPSEHKKEFKRTIAHKNQVVNVGRSYKLALAQLTRLNSLAKEAEELIKLNPSIENLKIIEEFVNKVKEK